MHKHFDPCNIIFFWQILDTCQILDPHQILELHQKFIQPHQILIISCNPLDTRNVLSHATYLPTYSTIHSTHVTHKTREPTPFCELFVFILEKNFKKCLSDWRGSCFSFEMETNFSVQNISLFLKLVCFSLCN